MHSCWAEAWQYTHSPSSKAAVLAANPFLMTKQQICANCTSYVTSYLAFRKTELCALEGPSGSGFALAAMPTSTETRALLFPEPCKILYHPEPSTCHCALWREAAQQNWAMPSWNQPLPVLCGYFPGSGEQPGNLWQNRSVLTAG